MLIGGGHGGDGGIMDREKGRGERNTVGLVGRRRWRTGKGEDLKRGNR